ncbi:MAG: hypothetical protein JNJ61_20765 [Anaerolineae bacterium]|nr:hypothetical protein [Anaerolineae bacterium]
MMDKRVEDILITLARQYAPETLRRWDRSGDYAERVPRLARQLANYDILVIMGDFPQTLQTVDADATALIHQWVNHHGQFYTLLAKALFPPPMQHIRAHYTDDRWPAIIYLRGTSTPLIQLMATQIVPFVAERQASTTINRAELVGLIDMALDDLEATSLPQDQYMRLKHETTEIVRKMLEDPIQQISLTHLESQLLVDSQRIKTITGTMPAVTALDTPAAAKPPAPPKLPEEIQVRPPVAPQLQQPVFTRRETQEMAPTQAMNTPEPPPAPAEPSQPRESFFDSPLPVFWNRNKDEEGKGRKSPLRPLPNKRDTQS